MHLVSDGIHDSGDYTLHFSKDEEIPIVLWNLSRANENGYEENWRKQVEEKRKAYEMYHQSVGVSGLEVCIPADGRQTYVLPDKIKDYFSQKLPGATLSQPCINVFRWSYQDADTMKKILG